MVQSISGAERGIPKFTIYHSQYFECLTERRDNDDGHQQYRQQHLQYLTGVHQQQLPLGDDHSSNGQEGGGEAEDDEINKSQ